VTEDELRDLQERALQIRELVRQPGWAILTDYVVAQIDAKNRRILAGRLHPDDYRVEAGWVQGATFVLGASDQLDRQVEQARRRLAEEA